MRPTTTTPRPLRRLAEFSMLADGDGENRDDASTPVATNDDGREPEQLSRWEGVIGMEGVPTGDGRLIQAEALTWDADPGPIRLVLEDNGAHDGAVAVGRITAIERREGGAIWAEGTFDLGGESGREAVRLVGEGVVTGVSMDLDSVSFEVRVAAELLDEIDAMDAMMDPLDAKQNADGTVTVATIGADDEVMVTTSARIRAVTLVAIPAFAEARIALAAPTETAAAEGEPATLGGETVPSEAAHASTTAPAPSDTPADAAVLIAAAIPVAPPSEWFRTAEADCPTPLTVTEDGRVYGHLATWDVCHIAAPAGEGVCIQAPHSARDYAHFHTGSVLTAENETVPTGRITMGTGHAAPSLGSSAALAHYDNTGTAVADVCAVDGHHGIWLSGALRPGTSPERVRALRGSPLSGDWRAIGGSLELVGALAVNVPGFPIPRPAGLIASGELMALVASGLVPPRRVARPGTPGALSVDDLRYLKRLAQRERETEAASLRERARLAINRQKVAAFAAARR